ncbi:Aldehyde/histidinol dehydrogenase, partial [Ephemerocybe angulata]
KKSKGAVLIISPWNYPIIFTFQPLCDAIAAGCPALIKPSELVPTFSKHLSELVPKYLDHAAYHVALGGVPEITKIIELKWAHIFYTGNAHVARVISAAAANHLTPMTLELGGKSPVIVNDANLGEGVCVRFAVFSVLSLVSRWIVFLSWVLDVLILGVWFAWARERRGW